MNYGKVVRAALCGFVVFGFTSVASAQMDEDNELFTVTVPSVLSITAPAPSVTINHPGPGANEDDDLTFPTQPWVAQCNDVLGAAVTFQLESPFVNTLDARFMRDAKIDIALDGAGTDAGANWNVLIGSGQTDYSLLGALSTAIVTAASDDPGQATFNVDVTFITENFSSLVEGDYTANVKGTIIANN